MRVGRWLLLAALVLAALLPAGRPMGPRDPGDTSRWRPNEPQSARSSKRHSEGTFSSDFTRRLDWMRAREFMHWLIDAKSYSSARRFLKDSPRSARLPLLL
ncbi:glucagon-2-like isoform X2 [Patagioenas fasciata]|uniref:glucagon-2-like isoform X2 n=1 Tax=Patagioenas fasciata TaxID=372321 RepID=UPI003A993AA2